ncbi:UDP-N-acetylmuramoyl-L-alanine--D-glutamate ligase [Asaia bogorensis]|uniref:UDP-N-acetylmuramoyl-L-alanine--D-glutamate ligase n=1 Tax=Asaia bogorensis TaxID=91915 RepID=UPI0028657F5A|nr:UDP-N-acetylmuramoyl-L-alanine--D-glutamate ligase [Asaia bogorensis]MDR6181640.1 UDP-N-acetylmuramoylalanine--D-glutamate ligase [Asaia bogorensis NBRC 16594]
MTGRPFPSDLFAGSRFAVVGLGRNGHAVVKALLGMGAEVQAWDDKSPPAPDAYGTQGENSRFTAAPLDDLTGFEALILSPGIPHRLPSPHPVAVKARDAGIPILSDAEILYRAVRKAGSKARFASITGTNGKSTTTALLAHMLDKAGVPVLAGGNLGTASLALPLLPDDGVYVIEMSSYMLERLDQYHAATACLLNLTPDHLDRHGDMAGYAAAKRHVFDNMTPDDLAVIGVDDAYTRAEASTLIAEGLNVVTISVHDETIVAPVAKVLEAAPTLPGAHNLQNALVARAMAKHLGLDDRGIETGLITYPGLPHRQALVGVVDGIRFINDSKATNAEAAEKALFCYDKVIWIAGGTAKSGGIEALAPLFDRIAKAFLIGRDAPILQATLLAHGVATEISQTLDVATSAALEAARALDVPVVLLSPACASFDQFASFEARGASFIDILTRLSDSETP